MTSLALTTKLAPTTKFTVDGEEFEILGLDHLSKDDEATVVALFARHNVLAFELDNCSDVARGENLAKRVRKTRILLITKLTTVPQETAEALPLPAQVQLLGAIQQDLNTEETDAEDGDDEVSPGAQATDD